MKISYETRVMEYLEEHGSVTCKEINKLLGTDDGRKIISNLIKSERCKIVKEWEEGKNRFGDPARWKRYYLVKDEDGEQTNV